MAGVGFELKKLFKNKEGYIDSIKAYSISAIVTQGPMILCIVMLLALRQLIINFVGSYHDRDVFVVTITYTMIFSMIFSNTINLFVSRYISDCIYQKRFDEILSAFYGAVIILLLIGGTSAGLFLISLELDAIIKIIIFVQFNIVMITWIQLTFLSALKKYGKILLGFFVAVVVAIGLATGLMFAGVNTLLAALIGSTTGYFIILTFFMTEIISYFPKGNVNIFKILGAIDNYKILLLIGFCMTFGLYGHNFLMWFSKYSQLVLNKMRYCMMYDIPTFYGSMSIIFMLVIFTVSLETNFYTRFSEYFNAILYGGRFKDMKVAYKSMVDVLMKEILKMCEIQIFFSVGICIFGVTYLQMIGMDSNMADIFRILVFGYYFYGIQQSVVIILLYFDDREGALTVTATFLISSVVLSIFFNSLGLDYYGLGFLVSTVITAAVALFRLRAYLNDIDYNIFCKQPIFAQTQKGFFTRLAEKLNSNLNKYNKA